MDNAKADFGFDLNDAQRRSLLQLGVRPEGQEEPNGPDRAECVLDLLLTYLPPTADEPEAVQIGETLLAPSPAKGVLRRIKEYAKQQGLARPPGAHQEAWLLVYNTAIAKALVVYDERITMHADRDLADFFGAYRDPEWIPPGLVELFTAASRKLKDGGEPS